VIEIPNYEDLPIVTEKLSAEWAHRIAMATVGDYLTSNFDLDLIERMVQAIRNEAAREVCRAYEMKLAQVWDQNWRTP
jgi:hypothetical protein